MGPANLYPKARVNKLWLEPEAEPLLSRESPRLIKPRSISKPSLPWARAWLKLKVVRTSAATTIRFFMAPPSVDGYMNKINLRGQGEPVEFEAFDRKTWTKFLVLI